MEHLHVVQNKNRRNTMKKHIVSFQKLPPNNVEQWVRGFNGNLLVMSSNPAWDFSIFTFLKILKRIFGIFWVTSKHYKI